MRIAMIGHKRIPSHEGGIETVVEALASRMAIQGHEVTAYNRGGRSSSEKMYQGVRIISIPTIQHKALNAPVYALLATLHALFMSRYDIIHFHAPGTALWLPLVRLLGVKAVVTIHGLDWKRAKWGGIGRYILCMAERVVVRWANKVTVLTQAEQKYFLQKYGLSTELICNGVVPTPQRKPEGIKALGLERDDYILFLGRLVPEKGIHLLIDAFKGIPTRKKLVIAGGSSFSDDYAKELQKQALQDQRVIMVGPVQGSLKEELYCNAFLFVLPSDVEGMPLSLLEALSCGTRCLTSDIDACVETLDGQGLIFHHGEVHDLEAKLNMALTGSIPSPNAEYICRKHDWDKVVSQYLTLYRDMISVHPS
ncbi:glycosyltransferase family 4 protein [Desulfovibrio falkowii]|uniref:Glycosyltransferase family 4 protein n=1 Tax=Desulfovibrio falkowii TaxID=3136602 RepID=A0ABQ0E7C9_9BACT